MTDPPTDMGVDERFSAPAAGTSVSPGNPQCMTLFAASIVIWLKDKTEKGIDEEEDGPCHLWERILLVRADDPDEATRKASEFGLNDARANSDDLMDEGKPAELVFMGVRKLREVDAPRSAGGAPDDVTEVSASEMEVASRADLLKLARGNEVIVRYVD
jgi:hypothetical protein